MCYYITLVVGGSSEQAIARVVEAHGRRLQPVLNPSVAAALKPDEKQFLTTVGGCDCGTALLPAQPELEDRNLKQASRLAKQGWSKSKIERWLADREGADARALTSLHARRPDSIELWHGLIGDLLALTGTRRAGLLVQYYSGDVNLEEFSVLRTLVPFSEFSRRLPALCEGELLIAGGPR